MNDQLSVRVKQMSRIFKYVIPFIVLLNCLQLSAQKNVAPKPLYDDPVFHGPADPVIIYNKQKKKWWMLYTNRRASIVDSTVKWVHGTRIGIAESSDGSTWKYVDTCNINYRPDEEYTHWAPDVIEETMHHLRFNRFSSTLDYYRTPNIKYLTSNIKSSRHSH